MLRVPPIDTESMTRQFGAETARLAGGSVTRAKELLDSESDSRQYFELYRRLMNDVVTRNLSDLKAWSDQLAGLGRERMAAFLDYAQGLTREAFISNLQEAGLNYFRPNENDCIQKFRRCIHTGNIEAVAEQWTRASREIAQNANARLVLLDLSLQLMTLIKL